MSDDDDQQDSFETEVARSLLDQLLIDSKLYTQSKDYKDLLDFVARLRNFAPFNAMLLQVQKPGLSYAASARDWLERFDCTPKQGARPLIILWRFGPVALVYDVQDIEGAPLPEDVAAFIARGDVTAERMARFVSLASKKLVECSWIDAGEHKAGQIRVLKRGSDEKEPTHYRMQLNRNHTPAVQFATLAHELGHLFMGHLGADKNLRIPERHQLERDQKEFEAESVSYIVCERNNVISKSRTYLSNYVKENTTVEDIDLYRVMWAADRSKQCWV